MKICLLIPEHMLEEQTSSTDLSKSKRACEYHFFPILQPGCLDTCGKHHKHFPPNLLTAWVLPPHSSMDLPDLIHFTQQELLQKTSCHVCLILQKAPAGTCTTPKYFLVWGEGRKPHTSVYSQSQEPNCITGSAEGVLCHSVHLQRCKYVAYLPSPLTNKSLPRYNAGKSSYRVMLLQPRQKDWGQQNSGDDTGKAPYISVLPPPWQMG